jgi:hypothetical protein
MMTMMMILRRVAEINEICRGRETDGELCKEWEMASFTRYWIQLAVEERMIDINVNGFPNRPFHLPPETSAYLFSKTTRIFQLAYFLPSLFASRSLAMPLGKPRWMRHWRVRVRFIPKWGGVRI